MSRVIVRGGSPGKIRVEVEGTDSSIEIDSGLDLYSGLHQLQPFIQALADAVPAPTTAATPLTDEEFADAVRKADAAIATEEKRLAAIKPKSRTLPPKGDA